MSHHFDYTADERLDISDSYCFAGPRDASGPRTVFGMNAAPNGAGPWDPAGYYELKVDTNDDLVEDITWRFTFPVDSAGVQHVVVAELTGREATDRNAKGRIITPRNAPVGEVLEVERGDRGLSDFVRRAVAAGMEAAGRSKEDIVRVAASEIRNWLDHLELDTELRKALSKMVLEVKAEIRFRPTEDGKLVPEAETDVKVRGTGKS